MQYRMLRKGSTFERHCTLEVSHVCMLARQSYTVCTSLLTFSCAVQFWFTPWRNHSTFGRLWSGFGLSCVWPFTGVVPIVGGSDALHCMKGCMYNEDCHGSTYSPLCSITFLGLLPYECLIHVKCYKGFRWETYTPSGCSVMVSAPGLPLDCHYPLGIILAAIYVNPIWNVWLCNTVTWHYNVLFSSHYMQRLLDNTWQCMPCLSPLGVSWTRLTRD